jgi:hypothetical protein
MADAKLLGLEKKLAAMRALPEKLQETCRAQLDAEAKELADAIRRVVPERTGTLRGTVRVEPSEDPLIRRVAAGGRATTVKVRRGVKDADFAKALQSGGAKGEYDYARGVEFGHLSRDGDHVGPRPFFFQTFRARRKAMSQRLKSASRRTIKALFPTETSGA